MTFFLIDKLNRSDEVEIVSFPEHPAAGRRAVCGHQRLPAEGEHQPVVLFTERVLDLVAVAPLFDGRDDRIELEAFELIRSELGNANLFAFGIGSSVNRWLIEGMARAGMGEPFFVLNPTEASQTASRFRDYIASPVLTDIKVRYEGFEAVDVQPESYPDVFADRPIELIGKWKGGASGRIIVTGQGGAGPYEASFDVSTEAEKGMKNPALRPLWAREKVRALADDSMIQTHLRGSGVDAETKREITTLGLTYGLLTDYTSFVGVDETPREVLDKLATVAQPLPLPKGVSNQAIGSSQMTVSHSGGSHSSSGAAPEPSVMGLLMITAMGLLLHRHRQPD